MKNLNFQTLPVVADALTKSFGDREAVRGVQFEVQAGTCYGILGPNGAGKTTTIRMMIGLVRRTSGALKIFGMDSEQHAQEIKQRVGVVPQNDNLDTDLTVKENLLTYASYFGQSPRQAREKADEMLHFFALESRAGDLIVELSGGQRRRLLLARALVNSPELLVLDEPTVGLDPQARHLMWDRLAALKKRGVTMILTSHYMEEVAKLSDRILIMDHGKVVAEGEPDTLIRQMVGVEVFEVSAQEESLVHLENIADLCGARKERFSDKLYVYVPRECAEIEEAVRQMSEWLRRPANLEDLFIHLTGRTLQEA